MQTCQNHLKLKHGDMAANSEADWMNSLQTRIPEISEIFQVKSNFEAELAVDCKTNINIL